MAASIPNPIPTKLLPTRNLMVSYSLVNRSTVFGDVSSLNVKSRKLVKYGSVNRRSTWNSSNYLIRSVLELDGVGSSVRFDSQQKEYQPKVANLKDILSERGACGVGFIANLRNEASHNVVEDALTALGCMEHRGGCGADNTSGDGSGVMTSIPWDLFDKWAQEQGIGSLDKKRTGVGMVFLPKDETQMNDAKKGESSVIRILHSNP